MPDGQSDQFNAIHLVLFCGVLCVCIYCVVTISIFFFGLSSVFFFSFKKLQNPNNNKAWNIGFESTHCNDYSILFLPSYLYIVQSLFFSMMTIFSRPFAFFVCFTHVKIIIKHHCDKLKQCLLALVASGSFVLFIAFVHCASLFTYFYISSSSFIDFFLLFSKSWCLGFIECNLFYVRSCVAVAKIVA